MPATNRKRTAALCSVFMAAGAVLAPIGFQQAASATPAPSHVGTATKAPASQGDYKRGFRDGFHSGYRDGRDCHHHRDHHDGQGVSLKDPRRDYQQGFKNGYKSGFRLGLNSC
ncbi:hypothetical protein AB0H51_05945 [Streptomyces griseoluteus]|uniref:hypothetical protein n=1 Tax=Streptomyces griseoluteus TaxID=29306 RepID=UPI0033DD4FEA